MTTNINFNDKDFNNKMLELKIKMMTQKVIYETAKEEYTKAQEIEKVVEDEATKLYNSKYKTMHDWNCTILDDGQDRFNDYLTIEQEQYRKHGINKEFNSVYTHKFCVNFLKAEKQYLLSSCEFLNICGKTDEANTIRTAINTYIKDDLKQQLININNKFLGVA